jgi:adenylosuccinate synthase
MVDLLSARYDVVVRYQGGNNAGHTVVNEKGKFIMNLLPSGILRDDTVNVLGPGIVIDLEHLFNETARLREGGIAISPANLKISDRATICMPYHKLLDGLEEDRLGDKKFGSTRRGISPVYADKYMKKALRMGDLRHLDELYDRLDGIVEWKNLTVEKGYGHEAIKTDDMMAWLKKFGLPFADYVCDTTSYLTDEVRSGKSVMFEAQLGALRDIDFGIYPYTSASTTLAAYAPVGAGIPQFRLDECVGITKAYSSCVGEGPFTCELFGAEGDALREAGGEYGAATGRPRRVGGFDAVASRYGVMMQGCTCIALTKLDVLSYLEKIPVCTHYEVDGKTVDYFPVGGELDRAKPVYEYMPGFHCDISKCRRPEELPKAALDYVRWIEKQVGCPIKYVSVGAERDDYIEMF